MRPHFITCILQAHTILDYLASHGHEPANIYSTRVNYNCPLHGPENSPSFYVFTDGEFQRYKCFGCGRTGDVIDLCSELEHISLKAAIKKLSRGLDITDPDAAKEVADYIESHDKRDYEKLNIEDIAVRLSVATRDYIDMVDRDLMEVVFIDKFHEKVDAIVHAMDYQSMEELYERVIDGGLLRNRLIEFNKRKEKERADRIRKQVINNEG